jgi:hypothetical protein
MSDSEQPKITLDQLRELIRTEVAASRGSTLDDLGSLAKGVAKSWQMWFGALLVAWPEVQPMLAESLIPIIGQENWGRALQLIGVAVILLRIKTTQSIAAKGKA